MGIKITELPTSNNPSPTTIILGVDIDADPDTTVKIPLSGLSLNNNTFVNVTANTYSLTSNNNGKVVLMNNQFPSTLYISYVDPGFSCSIIRLNNSVAFSNNGFVLNSVANSVNLASQFSSAGIICYTANTFLLYGDIS